MFKTIIKKSNEAKAVVGAAIATVKVVYSERKEINAMIAEQLPGLDKDEAKAYANQLSAYVKTPKMITAN